MRSVISNLVDQFHGLRADLQNHQSSIPPPSPPHDHPLHHLIMSPIYHPLDHHHLFRPLIHHHQPLPYHHLPILLLLFPNKSLISTFPSSSPHPLNSLLPNPLLHLQTIHIMYLSPPHPFPQPFNHLRVSPFPALFPTNLSMMTPRGRKIQKILS